jgi:hypothetical protein
VVSIKASSGLTSGGNHPTGKVATWSGAISQTSTRSRIDGLARGPRIRPSASTPSPPAVECGTSLGSGVGTRAAQAGRDTP